MNDNPLCFCRLAGRTALLAAILLPCGCASVPENEHRSSSPLASITSKIGGQSKEDSLRKQVEADSFPTAQQAGL